MGSYRYNRMSLKTQFVLLIIAILIPIFAILILSGYGEYKRILRTTDEEALALLSEFKDEQIEIIVRTEQFLKLLSHVPSIENLDRVEGNKFLQDIHEFYPQYSTIVAASPDGFIDICAIPQKDTINVQDRSWFQRLTVSGTFVIDHFIISRSSLNASLPFAYPVYDETGRLKAALGAEYNLDYYDLIFERHSLLPYSEFFVTDRNNLILYFNKQNMNNQNVAQKAESSGKRIEQISGFELPEDQKGFFKFQKKSGIPMMYWFEKLSVGEKSNEISLIIGISERELFADLRKTNRSLIMLFFLIAFCSLMSARIFGNSYIFKPLQILQNKARRVQEGDLTIIENDRELPKELQKLSEAFDLMTLNLSRREKERELAEARLQVLFEQASDAIYVSDETGRLTQVNKRASENTGFTQEELLCKNIYELDEDFSSEETFRTFLSTFLPGDSVILESRYARKDGTVLPVELTFVKLETLEGLRIMGIARDITERKKVMQEIFDISRFPSQNPNPVMRINREGKLLYINDSGSRVLKSVIRERTSLIDSELEEGFLQARASEKKSNCELKIGNSWYLMVFSPVTGEDYINVYGTDISETKRLLEEVNHSEKLRSIGKLAGGIAHDFNNQLAGIFGYADLLKMNLDDNSSEWEMVEHISKIALQAKNLITKLLSFSRKGKVIHEVIDINVVMKDVFLILESSIDKKIKLEFLQGDFKETIAGDPFQIHNVLLNIALNSRDAMPEGGAMKFATSCSYVNTDDIVKKGLRCEPGNYIEVSVSDTGHGMSPDIIGHALEPFFTTKPIGAGTGMGLSAAFGAMIDHGGELKIDSEVNKGTTVSLFFPAIGEEAYQVTNEKSPVEVVSGSGSVMLVDDMEIVCQTGEALLSSLGYVVQSFMNPLKAIEYYRKNHQSIDLVIIDMIMPEMNGSELFDALRSINSNVKVILSSGYSLEGETQGLLNKGVLGFIQKPFTIKQLSEEIKRVI